jgi:hypothetical protein
VDNHKRAALARWRRTPIFVYKVILCFGLAGCGGANGDARAPVDEGPLCERVAKAAGTLNAKAMPCANNPDTIVWSCLPYVTAASCTTGIGGCSKDEMQGITTFVDCIEALPMCAPTFTGYEAFKNAYYACEDAARFGTESTCDIRSAAPISQHPGPVATGC